MGYPDLLFRDERTDESTHRPYECNVHPGLPVPRRLYADRAAEEEPEVPQRAEAGLTGWIDCFPKSRLAGTLFCGGVADSRAINGHSKLNEAYEMGFHC